MNALLIKIFIETDSHGLDVEMFYVDKYIELLIDPKVGHRIKLPSGEKFYVHEIEQDLQRGIVVLYETTEVSHYEFWGERELFLEKYLNPLIKNGWTFNEIECRKKFLNQIKNCNWRRKKFESGILTWGEVAG